MADRLDDILDARAKTHGDYSVHAAITQDIKDVMHNATGWERLTVIQRESLEMFAHKIGRILAGDPNVHDHWDDIAGYSRLVSDRLPHASSTIVPAPSSYRPLFASLGPVIDPRLNGAVPLLAANGDQISVGHWMQDADGGWSIEI